MAMERKLKQPKAWRVAKLSPPSPEYGDSYEDVIDRMLAERRLRSEKCFSWRGLCRPETHLVLTGRRLAQSVFRVAGELLQRLRCVRGEK